MKIYSRILLIIVLLSAVSKIGFSDTIDFYHVFIGDEIYKFNQMDCDQPIVFNQKRHSIVAPTIQISKAKLKEVKRIIVKYFSDTPCMECDFYLLVNSVETKKTIQISKNKGQGRPLYIKTRKLLWYAKKTGESKFGVEYYEDDIATKKVIFNLDIE